MTCIRLSKTEKYKIVNFVNYTQNKTLLLDIMDSMAGGRRQVRGIERLATPDLSDNRGSSIVANLSIPRTCIFHASIQM